MKENVRQDEFIPTTQRIIQEVLAAVGLTAPKFADALGINYQRIFDLMRGRTKKFNPGIVNLICEKFPEVTKSVDGRTARLTEFERELNEREAALNARELDIEQREEELGVGIKKTV